MELTYSDEIPVTRVINGHNCFNKGYRHGLRGKTYEEYYGKETAEKMKKSKSKKMKGHPFWGNNKARAKKVVAINNGKIEAMFTSALIAADAMGVDYATIRRYIKNRIKPRNGWKWFYEDDTRWCELVNQ